MLLANINASLLRFCADFADTQPDMQVVNFDAYADEAEIPPVDVIGPAGVSVAIDDELCEINMMFGVSTREDTNLFRLSKYMDSLFDLLLPTKKIPLYNADSGQRTGWLVVENGTRLLAIGGSSTRPLQYIMVNLISTKTFS